ncbi:MurE-like ligase [Posidoniimonas polymericola]|uniref:MurE-like ligase n=1 Tax=Posidoniimonas polymericola TaxID=2528002 RepID=A0A5C5YKT4_9BACT|nr:Mur ligase family protein [Posidoniimonas polymericola]TWT75457.1 MurE-like ligase [Posidoniimonas polymericola]
MQTSLRQPAGVCLLETLADARVFGDRGIYAESCTTDATDTRPGDVYFAVDSFVEDVAAAAKLAVESGAKAIVTDQYLPIFDVPQFVVSDARVAYGEFCQQLVGDPSRSLTLAGVAGAHGKSTVSRLLTSILKHAGTRCGCLVDNLEFNGSVANENHHPAPGAARLARWLGDCDADGCQAAVLELSPRSLRQHSHAGVRLGLLCLTNQNFDRSSGRSPEDERQLAARLVADLPPFATLVTNVNDPHCVKLAAERDGLTMTYGLDKPADVQGTIIESSAGGQVLMVTIGCTTTAVSLPIGGEAFALDYLAAIASAHALGLALDKAATGAEAAPHPPGIMQPTTCGQSFTVQLDRGATPERVRAALNAARRTTTGRVIVVLPENPPAAVCTVATSLGDMVILPRDGEPSGEPCQTKQVEDRFSAIALALGLADPGDTVVLAGVPKPPACRRAEEGLVKQLLELRIANTREPVTMP